MGWRPHQTGKVHHDPSPRPAGAIDARAGDAVAAERPIELGLPTTVAVVLVDELPAVAPVAVAHHGLGHEAEAVAGELRPPREVDLGTAADELLVPAAHGAQHLGPHADVGAGGVWPEAESHRQRGRVRPLAPAADLRVVQRLVV